LFISSDNGVHIFSGFALKTTPSQTISVTDGLISKQSASITVNGGILDHFTFNVIEAQSISSPFSITITAKDASDNTVVSYTGTPSLTYSAGSINPSSMNPFIMGVGSTLVTVGTVGSSVTITVTDSSRTGISNSFEVTTEPKPKPTSTSQGSTTATPTPSNSSSVSPSPSPSGINLNSDLTVLPLSFLDISIFLAFLSVILLPTSKLIPRYYQMVTPLIHKLEASAVLVSVLFLLTVAIQVAMSILNL
jgi:hypothetical protein